MTKQDILEEQISFEYLVGRLSNDQRCDFESQLMDSTELQEDVMESALLMEMIKEYAVVCSRDSFRQVAAGRA